MLSKVCAQLLSTVELIHGALDISSCRTSSTSRPSTPMINEMPSTHRWVHCRPKGLCKVKKIPKIPKKLDRAHTTRPPPSKLFFWKPVTDIRQNTQIILTSNFYQRICRPNTHGILLQNITTGLWLFWDDLKKKTWTHPPTSIVISDFSFFAEPLSFAK